LSRPRWRETPDCASRDAGQLGDVQPLRARTRSRRSRASSPSSR
jgi:hypothetical protein